MTTKDLTKQLKKIETTVWGMRRKLLWLKPATPTRQEKVLRRTGGALKKSHLKNVLAWQSHLRSEWSHRP